MDIPTRRQQFKALVQAQSTAISALRACGRFSGL